MRALLIASLVVFVGCHDKPNSDFRSGALCSTAGTCPPGQDCIGGTCLRRCSTPGQGCMNNQPCECGNSFGGQAESCDFDSYCHPICGNGGPPPSQCVMSGMNGGIPGCPDGQVCDQASNFCRTLCSGVDGGGCPTGTRCSSVTNLACNVCVPIASSDGGVTGSFGGPCGSGGACNGSSLTCDSVTHTCQFSCGSGSQACGSFGNCPSGFGCNPQDNICRPLCQGNQCSPGSACFTPNNSSCPICVPSSSNATVIAQNQMMPTTLVNDGQFLYWTNNGCAGGNCAAIARIPLGGGGSPMSVVTFTSGMGGNPKTMAVDDTHVYLTAMDNHVWQAPKNGTGPLTIIGNSESNPTGIAAVSGGNPRSVFWTNQGNGTVIGADFSGGNRMTMASSEAGPGDITVARMISAQLVVWTSASGIRYVSTSGGSAMTVVGSPGDAEHITSDGAGNVFWSTSNGQIASWTGTGSATNVVPSQGGELYLATDGSTLYFTSRTNGTVMKVSTGGGTVQMIAQGQQQPAGITVDNSNVYWTNQANNTIMKAPK